MPDNQDNQNEAKNKVDGIKKLSGAELEKSRRIVLDTIGEDIKSKNNYASKTSDQSDKMVDSLMYKNLKQKTKEIKPITEEFPEIKKQFSSEQKNNILKAIGAEEENTNGNIKIIDKLKTKLKFPDINR
jgi:hypothetical protein